MKSNRSFGFTLIELMIVVAIMAVLAAIAYPAYQRYGFRARRSDGKNFILAFASAEERYFTNFNTYTTDATTLGFATTSPYGYYSAAVAAGTLDPSSCSASTGAIATSYIVTVTPVAVSPQAADACGALTYDSLGNRCPSAANSTANSNGTCW